VKVEEPKDEPVQVAKLDPPKLDNSTPTVPQTKGNEWPDASKVPAAPEAALQALAVPATTPKNDPTLSDYQLPEGSQEVAKVIAAASDLTVPPTPVLKNRSSGAPSVPIVWEHEKIAIEKSASATLTAPAPTTSQTPTPAAADSGDALVKSDKEKRALSAKKTDERERIASVDTKLKLFNLKDAGEARTRLAEIDKELSSIDQALDQTAKNLETARRRYQVWNNRRNLTVTGEAMKLADEVSISSVQVKRKKEAHDVASMRYLDAVELWRESPNDSNTANMAALGRELKNRRAELEESIVQAVDSSLEQAKFDIAEFGVVRTDLERRKDRLNRHAGFYKAYNLQVSGDRVAAQRQLLDERAKAVAELESLRSKLSDEDELQFRRESVLRQLGVIK
jgi:hypothetical protein